MLHAVLQLLELSVGQCMTILRRESSPFRVFKVLVLPNVHHNLAMMVSDLDKLGHSILVLAKMVAYLINFFFVFGEARLLVLPLSCLESRSILVALFGQKGCVFNFKTRLKAVLLSLELLWKNVLFLICLSADCTSLDFL